MKPTAKLLWAYASELILAGTLTSLACRFYGLPAITKFITLVAIDAAAYVFSILLAAALGLIWTIFSKVDSDFYSWLAARGALSVFLNAFRYVAAIELTAVTFSILAKYIQEQNFFIITIFVMLLGAINGITMVGNIFDLIKLNILYDSKK